MTHLLEKDTPFVFSNECLASFKTLKKKLTEAPILVSLDWDLPFELMCDASDYAVGAVLGKRKDKYFRPIHYTSKILLDAQTNYTVTEKELLAVVYAFEKFRSYLVLSNTIVYTDHSALKYIFNKQDAKLRLLRKLWTFSKLAIMDPPTVTMARTTQRKKFLTLVFSGPPFIVMPRTLSRIVTRVSVRERSHNMTKCPIILFRLSTSYHLQTSSHVEVSNRGLKRILERTVGEHRARWADKLDDALWAFRTAFKTLIGCTPYNLVYRKACHLPIELKHKAYWALKWTNFDLKIAGDHCKVQLNELNKLQDQAYENSLIYKEKTKKIHDSKIKNCKFHVGDRVLLFNSRLKILSSKLKSHWTGPFTVA
nr:reverse transcriptase domain-containing protein [Tanacetum cinerariifolium]